MKILQPLSHYTHSREIMNGTYDDIKVSDYINYKIVDTNPHDKNKPSSQIRTLEDFSYTSHDGSIFY